MSANGIDRVDLEEAVREANTFTELLITFIRHNTEGVGAESPMRREEAAIFNTGLITLQSKVQDRLMAAIRGKT